MEALKREEVVLAWELADPTTFSKSPCGRSSSSTMDVAIFAMEESTPSSLACASATWSRDLEGAWTSTPVFTGGTTGESRAFDFARCRSLALSFAARGAAGKKSAKPAIFGGKVGLLHAQDA